MITSVRSHSVNPGIVPPYLQHPGAAAAPVVPGGTAGKHSNITILIPASVFGQLVRRQQQPQELDQGTPQEQQAAQQAVDAARNYFGKLGVSDSEGNSSDLPIVIDPPFPNAEYTQTRTGRDVLHIGSDPKTGTSFAYANDVIAHEYTHRVMEHIVALDNVGESGTINESLADTFAAAIDSNDWTMGEDVRPGGLRSLNHPEAPQYDWHTRSGDIPKPGNMRDYLALPESVDNGGVHINVGIPNKAASIIGDTLGRDTMAKIYLDAARNYLRHDSGIADLANATEQSAADLFGASSRQSAAVQQAWQAVGV